MSEKRIEMIYRLMEERIRQRTNTLKSEIAFCEQELADVKGGRLHRARHLAEMAMRVHDAAAKVEEAQEALADIDAAE